MCEQAGKGLHLGTVHSAKGLEFRHVVVLDGDWNAQPQQMEEERRLYYVAMTRAEQTLTLCEFAGGGSFSRELADLALQQDYQGSFQPGLQERFYRFSLKDIFIDYAGRQSENAAIHRTIAGLREGDPLYIREVSGSYEILASGGAVIGRTSKQFHPPVNLKQLEVAAIVTRYLEDSGEDFRSQCKVERWEVVVPGGSGVAD
jgi:ATP-dependent DNA helicase RecQ